MIDNLTLQPETNTLYLESSSKVQIQYDVLEHSSEIERCTDIAASMCHLSEDNYE